MSEQNAAALEVWKTTIEVQKHFNELAMRVRSIAVTVLAALLAAAGYALREPRPISLTGLILLAALICWLAFYVMDRLWYHRLLRAAVRHGRTVENSLEPSIPTIGLTKAIDEESPIFGLRAGHRLTIFYISIGILICLAAGLSLNAKPLFYIVGVGGQFAFIVADLIAGSRRKEASQPSASGDHTDRPAAS